jgi:hypothetical protein
MGIALDLVSPRAAQNAPLAGRLAPVLLNGVQRERYKSEMYHAGTSIFGCGSI